MTKTLTQRTLPHLQLQPADIELVRLLREDFVLLTRSQICELFPGRSIRRTNFRLRKLRQAAYLSRRYPAGMLVPKIPLYYIGPRAAEALSRDPRDPGVLSRRKQALQLRDASLPHLLLVNSVHIKFLSASRHYSDFELLSWIPQYDSVWQTLNQYGFPLRPDGYGEYRKELLTLRFFLELDRGTERGRALHNKLAAYTEYARSGRFEEHFSASGFRVLFIPPTLRRARQLLRAISSHNPDLFWVTPADQFFHQPLFDPHWQCPNSDILYSLDIPL